MRLKKTLLVNGVIYIGNEDEFFISHHSLGHHLKSYLNSRNTDLLQYVHILLPLVFQKSYKLVWKEPAMFCSWNLW